MSTNPIQFRIPQFDLTTEEGRQAAHRYVASGLVDLNQAVAALKPQVDSTATVANAAASSSGTSAGVSSFNSETGAVVYFPQLGTVNDQIGQASYATQQSDNGAKIIVGDASGVAVTLSPTVTAPWFTIIDNDSSAIASLTAGGGSLFGAQEIVPGGFGIVFFDGTDFWADAAGGLTPQTFIPMDSTFLTGYDELTGLFSGGMVPIATDSSLGVVQPDGSTITVVGGIISATGGGGGITVQFGSGSPNGAPASVVQATSNNGSNSLAFGSNVAAGNLMFAAFTQWHGGLPTALTDTLGTSWTLLFSLTASGYPLLVWVGVAPSSGPNTVALTGGPGAYGVLAVMEVAACTPTVDVQGSGTTSPLSVTTTFAEDFLFAASACGGGATPTWASPFTIDAQDNSFGNSYLDIGHDIVHATGTYALTITAGTTNNLAIAAFKSSTTPVAGAEGDLYFDTSASPFQGYVYHSGTWSEFQ
jgi:hypothetical protein